MSLIVDEEYICEMGEYIRTQNEAISDFVSEYTKYMNDLIERGFSEGKTSDALKEFVEQMYTSSDEEASSLKQQGLKAKRFCDNYIIKIDEADEDLY